jgi:hypothetical protein
MRIDAPRIARGHLAREHLAVQSAVGRSSSRYAGPVSRRSRWFVVASWVLAVNFAGWVLLQYNDPDPARWMTIYGATAVAAAAVPYWRRAWLVALIVAAVAAVWAVLLWSGVMGQVEASDLWRKMSEKGGRVEELREAGGLTIAAAWLVFAAIIGARADRAAPPA